MQRPSFGSAMTRPEVGAIFGAVALWLMFAVLAGDRGFLSGRGTASYLEVAAQLGIVSVAVSLLMIGGEFDLSIGSTIGAVGMIITILTVDAGWNLWPAIGVSLLVALAIGAMNGVLVRWSRLPSFIVTLATLFIVRGLTIALTRLVTNRTQLGGLTAVDGFSSAKPIFASHFTIGSARWPVSIFWWIALTAIATLVLLRTPVGNWIFGTGGNEQAARTCGVPVGAVKIGLFMATAASAWLIAVMQVVSTTGADVLRGQQTEFYAIMAAVIGGTLMTGGYGSAIGASIGALIFGMVKQGIVYAGIDADWFQVCMGGMVLFAVLLNQSIRRRALGGRS